MQILMLVYAFLPALAVQLIALFYLVIACGKFKCSEREMEKELKKNPIMVRMVSAVFTNLQQETLANSNGYSKMKIFALEAPASFVINSSYAIMYTVSIAAAVFWQQFLFQEVPYQPRRGLLCYGVWSFFTNPINCTDIDCGRHSRIVCYDFVFELGAAFSTAAGIISIFVGLFTGTAILLISLNKKKVNQRRGNQNIQKKIRNETIICQVFVTGFILYVALPIIGIIIAKLYSRCDHLYKSLTSLNYILTLLISLSFLLNIQWQNFKKDPPDNEPSTPATDPPSTLANNTPSTLANDPPSTLANDPPSITTIDPFTQGVLPSTPAIIPSSTPSANDPSIPPANDELLPLLNKGEETSFSKRGSTFNESSSYATACQVLPDEKK